ncbi:MAG: energy transducer TonB [Terriglobales bacterium]
MKLEGELPAPSVMLCLWPSTKTTSIKALAAAVVLAGFSGVLAPCSVTSAVTSPSTIAPRHTQLSQLEKSLRRVPAHISEFAPVSEPLALPKCGKVRPPEALLTPDPLLHFQDDDLHVRVSFIVGSDGHVHSPFVLDSGGPVEDQIVLRAVRFWRYRPALCNGVPTDSEALVRFSIR